MTRSDCRWCQARDLRERISAAITRYDPHRYIDVVLSPMEELKRRLTGRVPGL